MSRQVVAPPPRGLLQGACWLLRKMTSAPDNGGSTTRPAPPALALRTPPEFDRPLGPDGIEAVYYVLPRGSFACVGTLKQAERIAEVMRRAGHAPVRITTCGSSWRAEGRTLGLNRASGLMWRLLRPAPCGPKAALCPGDEFCCAAAIPLLPRVLFFIRMTGQRMERLRRSVGEGRGVPAGLHDIARPAHGLTPSTVLKPGGSPGLRAVLRTAPRQKVRGRPDSPFPMLSTFEFVAVDAVAVARGAEWDGDAPEKEEGVVGAVVTAGAVPLAVAGAPTELAGMAVYTIWPAEPTGPQPRPATVVATGGAGLLDGKPEGASAPLPHCACREVRARALAYRTPREVPRQPFLAPGEWARRLMATEVEGGQAPQADGAQPHTGAHRAGLVGGAWLPTEAGIGGNRSRTPFPSAEPSCLTAQGTEDARMAGPMSSARVAAAAAAAAAKAAAAAAAAGAATAALATAQHPVPPISPWSLLDVEPPGWGMDTVRTPPELAGYGASDVQPPAPPEGGAGPEHHPWYGPAPDVTSGVPFPLGRAAGPQGAYASADDLAGSMTPQEGTVLVPRTSPALLSGRAAVEDWGDAHWGHYPSPATAGEGVGQLATAQQHGEARPTHSGSGHSGRRQGLVAQEATLPPPRAAGCADSPLLDPRAAGPRAPEPGGPAVGTVHPEVASGGDDADSNEQAPTIAALPPPASSLPHPSMGVRLGDIRVAEAPRDAHQGIGSSGPGAGVHCTGGTERHARTVTSRAAALGHMPAPAPHPFQQPGLRQAAPPCEWAPSVVDSSPTANAHPAMGARTPGSVRAWAAPQGGPGLTKEQEASFSLAAGAPALPRWALSQGTEARTEEGRQRQREEWVERVRRKKRGRTGATSRTGPLYGPTAPRPLLEVMPAVRRSMEAATTHSPPRTVLPEPCEATVLRAHPAPDAFTVLRGRRAFPNGVDRAALHAELERVFISCAKAASASAAKWVLHESMAEYLLGLRVTGLEWLPHELHHALRTNRWGEWARQLAPPAEGRVTEEALTSPMQPQEDASPPDPTATSQRARHRTQGRTLDSTSSRRSRHAETAATESQAGISAGATPSRANESSWFGDLGAATGAGAPSPGSPLNLEELLSGPGPTDADLFLDFEGADMMPFGQESQYWGGAE